MSVMVSQSERVRVFVCLYCHSRFAFKQQQRKRNIGLCGCQSLACPHLVLAGLKPPDGGRIACGFVSSAFFAKS